MNLKILKIINGRLVRIWLMASGRAGKLGMNYVVWGGKMLSPSG